MFVFDFDIKVKFSTQYKLHPQTKEKQKTRLIVPFLSDREKEEQINILHSVI